MKADRCRLLVPSELAREDAQISWNAGKHGLYPLGVAELLTIGYKGTHPTLILKAIAEQCLWIWHAHFGMTGSNNDINILHTSHLFNKQYMAMARSSSSLQRTSISIGGILWLMAYTRGARISKGSHLPVFGMLQARWATVKGSRRFWYKTVVTYVMYVCRGVKMDIGNWISIIQTRNIG